MSAFEYERSSKKSKVSEPTQAPLFVFPPDDTHDCPEDDARHQAIANAAYYRAGVRSFALGGEREDWLMAERDVDLWFRLAERL